MGAAALVVGNPGPAASPLARGVVLTGVYLAYFTVFLALSLAVSAWARSARTALVILLGVWVVNGLVAPRVAVDLSKWLHPTPSAIEFARTVESEMASGVGDISRPDRDASTERLLAEYGVEQVEDLPINAVGVYLQESEEFGNRIFDRNYSALWDTFERQGVVHETLAVAAPLLAVRTLSMGLAGTDVEQHRHFATAAETYRRDLMRRMNGDMAENSRTGDFEYAADAELWESVPPLQYAAPTLGWVLGNRILSLLVLGAWLAGTIIVAAARVRRARRWRRMTARTVLRNEWRLLMADRALRIVLGLFAVLLVYALANGVVWMRFQERIVETVQTGNVERARAIEQELAAIENGAEPASRFSDPRAPNVLGGARGSHTAVLTPGPLTALAVGQSDLLPYYYDVNIYTNESSFHQNGESRIPST